MKRTPFKPRKTPLKRSYSLKRGTGLKMTGGGLKRTIGALRAVSKSDTAQCKKRIQELLNKICRLRDGGCVLRGYEEAGACGGRRKDGELIFQAEHLVSRGNSVSFADLRNIVLLCRNHHFYFKPQHPLTYWQLIEQHIGPERWAWIKKVEAEERAHKSYRFTLYDWQKIEMELKAHYETIRGVDTKEVMGSK